jgi:hypothetical protein
MDLLDDAEIGRIDMGLLLAFCRSLARAAQRNHGQTYENERGQKPQ